MPGIGVRTAAVLCPPSATAAPFPPPPTWPHTPASPRQPGSPEPRSTANTPPEAATASSNGRCSCPRSPPCMIPPPRTYYDRCRTAGRPTAGTSPPRPPADQRAVRDAPRRNLLRTQNPTPRLTNDIEAPPTSAHWPAPTGAPTTPAPSMGHDRATQRHPRRAAGNDDRWDPRPHGPRHAPSDSRDGANPGTNPGPDEPAFQGPLHSLSRAAWRTVLLTGIASLVLGVLVLVWPGASLRAAGVLFGLYLVISGVPPTGRRLRARTGRPRCGSSPSSAARCRSCWACSASAALCGRYCCSRCGSASAGSSAASRRSWPPSTTRRCPRAAGTSSSAPSPSSPASC